MIFTNLNDLAILIMQGTDDCWIRKRNGVKLLQNTDLTEERGVLWKIIKISYYI